ncbi:MAG TPA: hypothetical protein VGL15_15860 [Vicinamibacteria bacterium]|jgi:hypothetical protein
MKILFAVGLVLLILGVVSLFVPVPNRERHSVEAGPVRIGVETTDREKVHPAVSAVLIAGGIVLLIADSRRKRP